jgi:hypothetical protein
MGLMRWQLRVLVSYLWRKEFEGRSPLGVSGQAGGGGRPDLLGCLENTQPINP